MCLIGLRISGDGALLVAANRDEFAARPTQPMHWWEKSNQPSDILAGKDLAAGGTWLGMTRSGRFAAVTNVRDPLLRNAPVPLASRGLLVTEYLKGSMDARDYIRWLESRLVGPSSFNLIAGVVTAGRADLYWYGARAQQSMSLATGVHVLSNAELNTPWPKAQMLRHALSNAAQTEHAAQAEQALTSMAQADDHLLPDTGVGYAWEKKLSSALITGDDYHTRSSTFISTHDGQVQVREITWSPDGSAQTEVREAFAIAA